MRKTFIFIVVILLIISLISTGLIVLLSPTPAAAPNTITENVTPTTQP